MANSFFSPLFAITDEQSMWRVQTQADAAAFTRLVERWEKPIRRLAVRMTGDVQRGEDLAQETFARLFSRRHDYQPSGKFSTWLWRVALNLCYDELRRVKRRGEAPLDTDGEGNLAVLPEFTVAEPSPAAVLETRERADLVCRALLQLAEPYRAVLVLRHYENLKFREIAEVLEIPEGTVKSRMAEALTQLTQLLRPAMETDDLPKLNEKPDRRILI